MSLETLTAPLEIKLAGSTDTGEFEGYGAFFGNVDAHGDAIEPGAFAATLAARKAQGRPPVPMHFNHGSALFGGESAVGVWRDMSEDAKGLRVRGRISGMNTDRGRYYFERVKDGAISGLSIGFRIPQGGSTPGPKGGPQRVIKAIDLVEVSIVDDPANTLARVDAVKLAGIADLEELLRRGGLSKAAARRVAAGGWPALSGDPDPDLSEARQKAAATVAELQGVLTQHLSELKGLSR